MKNIFISSTFRDMHAERDLVQERVLPMLRAKANEYGDNVEAIDLRWGVDTSTLETDEGSAKVLKVCLDEIDRSHPYMLIFLGERYGWIPKGELIEKAVKSRGDNYITDDFEKSVTALEIEYGALSKTYGDIKHCVVCLRESVTEGMDDTAKSIYTEQEEKGIQKLQALKERIREKFGENGKLISYTGTWDESAQTLVDLRADGQPLEEVLLRCYIEMFQQDWNDYKKLSWQEKEQIVSKALAEKKRHFFTGREELLEEYYQKVVNGNGALLLQGEAGCGKTAIMCKLAERLQKEGKRVFYFFSGIGNRSKRAYDFVEQMMYHVENVIGIEEKWEDDIWKEVEKLKKEGYYKCLSAEGSIETHYEVWWSRTKKYASGMQEKIYFFVDSLEQLKQDKHAKELDFLIENEKIQMILSCSDEYAFSYENMEFIQRERVPLLKEEEIKAVAKSMLKSHSRDTYEELEQEMLKKKKIGNPLYISFLVQRLNMMGQEELGQLKTGDEIRNYVLNIIRQLPEELDEAAAVILKTAVGKISPHGGDLKEALYFIAISRNGLRIRDLQKLLKNQTVALQFLDVVTRKDWRKEELHEIFQNKDEAFSALNFTLLMKYLDSFFYSSEFDKIDFAHKGIRLQLRKEIEKPGFYEVELKNYIKRLEPHDELWKQEAMYFARITRDYEMAAKIITDSQFTRSMEDTILTEAMENHGEFYCEMMRRSMGKVNDIKLLQSMRYFTAGYNGGKLDMVSRFNMTETRVLCWEEIYTRKSLNWTLSDLAVSYEDMGENYRELGRMEEAVFYYKKAGESFEKLYEIKPEEWVLKRLYKKYNFVRFFLQKLEQKEEAILYYEKEVHCKEIMYEKDVNDKNLQELCVDYNKIGNDFTEFKRFEEALIYYEKSMKCKETLYDLQRSESCLFGLTQSYKNMGAVLQKLGRWEEALCYCEKDINCGEALCEQRRSRMGLRQLLSGYRKRGDILSALGRVAQALESRKKAVEIVAEINENNPSEYDVVRYIECLRELSYCLFQLGRIEEAEEYEAFARELEGRLE